MKLNFLGNESKWSKNLIKNKTYVAFAGVLNFYILDEIGEIVQIIEERNKYFKEELI